MTRGGRITFRHRYENSALSPNMSSRASWRGTWGGVGLTHARKHLCALGLLLVVAAAACGTSDPALTPEPSPIPVVGAAAAPTTAPPTQTVAVPTPTTTAPAPVAPSNAGIDVDPSKAEATLVQLVDALDEPEYYCVDVPGFGRSLQLDAALMAHTCKPGADDEMFAVNRPGPGNLSMPAYDLCMEADAAGSTVQIYLRKCSDSEMQRFELDSDGGLVLAGAGLCMVVSPEDGEPTGGPSHLRRDLYLLDCDEAEPALKQWAFPGSSPE